MVKIEQLEQIAQGWVRFGLSKMHFTSDKVKARAEERIAVCDTCEMRVDNTCSTSKEGINVVTRQLKSGCGCNLSAKALADEPACPLSKWDRNEL